MMNYALSFVILAMLSLTAQAAMSDYPSPPPTFEASAYTTWDSPATEDFLNGSRRGLIHVPYEGGDISMVRIDLASDWHYQRCVEELPLIEMRARFNRALFCLGGFARLVSSNEWRHLDHTRALECNAVQ
jgi:hypothetical protein